MYSFDGINLNDWGIQVQQVTGHLGFPERKTPVEYDWENKDGVQAYTDYEDIQFKARDITLQCIVYADTEADFHVKLSHARSKMTEPGLHELVISHAPNTFEVFLKENSKLNMLSKWNDSGNYGQFYLVFREPYPSYPALWKGCEGWWKLNLPDEVFSINEIPFKLQGADQEELITKGALDDDNGNFESAGADGTDIETGTDWIKTNCSAETDNEAGSGVNTYNGSDFCCKIYSATDNNPQIKIDGANFDAVFTANKKYRISYDYKVKNCTVARIRLRNNDSSVSKANSLTSESWKTDSFTLETNSNLDMILYIYLYEGNNETGDEVVWIDNISIKQIGCVADYSDTKSASTWTDDANANNGTVSGAKLITGNKVGQVYSFDGIDDYIQVPDATEIQNIFDNGGSVSFWIYPKSSGELDNGRFISKQSDGNGYQFYLFAESGGYTKARFKYEFSDIDGIWSLTDTIIPINKWTFVVVKYDNGDVTNNPTFYINGVPYTVGNGLTENTTPIGTRGTDVGEDLYIGNNSGGIVTFDGLIAQVRLWDGELTQEEIVALMGIEDHSHNTNYGMIDGAAWGTNKAGTSNKALDFDGTNDYFSTQDTFEETFQNDFSMAMWIKPDDGNPPNTMYFAGVENDTGEDGVRLYITAAGKVGFEYKSDNVNVNALTSDAVFTNGAQSYTHIAVCADAGKKAEGGLSIYIDKVKQTCIPDGDTEIIDFDSYTAEATKNGDLFIGAFNQGSLATAFFDGKIDNIRIYKRKISQDEINLLYNLDDGVL